MKKGLILSLAALYGAGLLANSIATTDTTIGTKTIDASIKDVFVSILPTSAPDKTMIIGKIITGEKENEAILKISGSVIPEDAITAIVCKDTETGAITIFHTFKYDAANSITAEQKQIISTLRDDGDYLVTVTADTLNKAVTKMSTGEGGLSKFTRTDDDSYARMKIPTAADKPEMMITCLRDFKPVNTTDYDAADEKTEKSA